MQTQAIVSKKGRVTLPPAMRELLGIRAGSRIKFELRGSEIFIVNAQPMSAYYGILKGCDLGNIEPAKEPDPTFD